MNQWDLDNFRFLMNIKQQEFDAWMEQASDDDIEYALELIKYARTELAVQLMEAAEEMEEFEEMDLTLAKEVLGKFAIR